MHETEPWYNDAYSGTWSRHNLGDFERSKATLGVLSKIGKKNIAT